MKLIVISYLVFGDNFSFVYDNLSATNFVGHVEDEVLLESIFRDTNHVDGTEWIAGKPLRSLSVGDVVTIIDSELPVQKQVRAYRVEGIGWKKLE